MEDVKPLRLTLMCRDHEVAVFSWDVRKQSVAGKCRKSNLAFFLFAALIRRGLS